MALHALAACGLVKQLEDLFKPLNTPLRLRNVFRRRFGLRHGQFRQANKEEVFGGLKLLQFGCRKRSSRLWLFIRGS